MLNEKPRWLWIAIIVFCLSYPASAQDGNRTQVAPSAQSSDEAALRSLVDRYFVAYAGKDLEGFFKLWSRQAPDLEARRQSMQRVFAGPNYRFSNPAISKAKIAGDRASLRVAVDRAIVVTQTAQAQQFRSNRMILNFECAREDGEWKFRREAPAVGDLLTALLKVKSDEEGKALLAEEGELVTPELQQLLTVQADRFYAQANYSQAVTASQAVKNVAERLGDRKGAADAWSNIGNAAYLQRNYRLALEAYQQSLKFEEELENKAGVANALLNLGHTYFVQGDFTSSLAHYQKSLAAREGSSNKAEIANTLEHIANAQYEQGHYGPAIESYQKSLALRDEAREKPRIASTLERIGSAEYDQGNWGAALDYYQQALARFQTAGDKQSTVRALHSVANIHYQQSDLGSALGYYQQSLRISEQVGYMEGMSSTLFAVGLVRHLQGNLGQALEYYRRCLTVREALDDKPGMAEPLSNIGGIRFWQGEYKDALEAFERNLALKEAAGDKATAPWVLLDIGLVYAAQAETTRALEYYQKSRAQFEALGDQAGIANALLSIGTIDYLQERYAAALELADKAASLAKVVNSSDLFWHARLRAGKAHRKLDQLAQARQAFEEAIVTIESKRAQAAPGGQEQRRLFEDRTAPYLAMVSLLLSQGQDGEAFAYAERAKARVLFGMLQGGRVRITKGMTAREQEQEQKLKGEIASLSSQIGRERQRRPPNNARLGDLTARWQKARQSLESFQARLYAARPQLKVLRGEAQPVTSEQAIALVLDARTALLEFVETEEGFYLFALTRGQTRRAQPPTPAVRAYPVDVSRHQLADRVTSFQQLIVRREEGVEQPARELYDLLLRPAQEQLAGKTSLVIVPDGVLWRLPFQALQPAENRYLLEEQVISYAPSLTALRAMRRRRNPVVRRALPALLALGNPELGKETVERVKAMLGDEPLEPLPEAEREVTTISQLYRTGQSKVLLGAEANEEQAKAEAGKYQTLHLAAHGLLNDATPMYSHLLLARAGEAGGEDGLLEAWEMMQWELQARIAVLSVCASPPVRAGWGNGTTGLAWALFVAGCPTTLVSQWKVASESTTELMAEFHRHLSVRARPPATKAQAWRAAAMKLMQHDQFRHPFYWSGFWIVGDGF